MRAGPSSPLRVAVILLAASLVISACGPASYIYTVTNEARRLVSEAKTAGAEKHAPYEYWSAVTYLRMAREMAAHADYQIAVDYGRRAVKMGERAQKLCEERRRDGPTDYSSGGGNKKKPSNKDGAR